MDSEEFCEFITTDKPERLLAERRDEAGLGRREVVVALVRPAARFTVPLLPAPAGAWASTGTASTASATADSPSLNSRNVI